MTAGNEESDTLSGVVTSHLPYLDTSATLAETDPLDQFGLDSMEALMLLVDIERTFGIEFPDELLDVETFATMKSLRHAVERCIASVAKMNTYEDSSEDAVD